MRSLSYIVHFGCGVPGWGATRSRKSWVQSVRQLRYLLWKGVVSVWPEGTLGRMSPLCIRQTCPFFSMCYSALGGHARKNSSRFESVWIFYDFPGRKPRKCCPDVTQRAFIVGFHSFWPWGARVGRHMRFQKLGAFWETARALGVEGGGFGMGGGDPWSYVSPSHPPNSLIFFHRPQ